MQTVHDTLTTNARLVHVLDELSAGCDADFDAEYDDLEREFAELRLHLAHS
jgi:hypothetical protein